MNLAGVVAAYIRNEFYMYDWYVAEVAVGEVIASGVCGEDIIWTLTSDGTLTVTGNGEMKNYTSTTTPWYGYMQSIFSVVIEGDITNIGRYAFAGAGNLLTVTVPDTLTSIGDYAFYGCSALEELAIPASVKYIGRMAFAKCPLASVTFGNAEGWTAGGVAILSSQLLNPETAAECVALNVSVEWKVEDETAGE